MLKKPPDFGGLTHKIRKIVFSYFRCPVFAFLVSRFIHGDITTLRSGIEHYLTPTRAQPRDTATLVGQYSEEKTTP